MLILQSETKFANGRYPSRIVLRQVKSSLYATHIKIMPPDAEPYFILGCYFSKLEEAKANFRKRCEEIGVSTEPDVIFGQNAN